MAVSFQLSSNYNGGYLVISTVYWVGRVVKVRPGVSRRTTTPCEVSK